MQVVCPHCRRTLEFSGAAPRFCAYCGEALSAGSDEPTLAPHEAATLTQPPGAATPGPSGAGGAPAVPERIGDYRLLRTLGSGGMGTVYEAEDLATRRHVALKLIAPNFAASRDAVERFRQEGRLASAIAHPRCVFVVATDEDAGRPYIVMELMPGTTLEDLIRKSGPLPPREAVARILDVIEGLEEAHRLGVIHRDVKPSNCFVDQDGRVKIGDFGLSKSLVSDSHLTKTGSFLGTVLYGSPEQLRREQVDQQTDVYSVAATLYYLLTGKAPFQTGDAMATIAQILSEPPTPLRTHRPELPPALERVVLKGLERDRVRRYKNLDEFRQALLPFYHRQFAIGSIGWRLAAYVLDAFAILLLKYAAILLLAWTRGINFATVGLDPKAAIAASNDSVFMGLGHMLILVWIMYFAAFEALLGFSPGKALVRLRVFGADSDERPAFRRVLVRTLLCFALTHLGDLGALAITYASGIRHDYDPLQSLTPFVLLIAVLVGVTSYGGWILGIVALVAPMRTRNGHRGLHELASGTRVVRLPDRQAKHSLRGRIALGGPTLELLQPADLPDRIGPFAVLGALRWDSVGRVVLAEDQSLQRRVWVWLRPEREPPLNAARQALNRTSRLRWLLSGSHNGWHWEAFVAPSGGPLTALVKERGALAWPETRPILEQLSYELALAAEERTLPEVLDVSQLWIQQNERPVLLDTPPVSTPGGNPDRVPATVAGTHGKAHATPTSDDILDAIEEPDPGPHALDLLEDAMALALEGRPRLLAERGRRIHAPLPGRVAEVLHRLVTRGVRYTDPRQLTHELSATSAYQDEVTRLRRFGHLALLIAFSSLWLMCCVPAFGVFVTPPFMAVSSGYGVERIVQGMRAQERLCIHGQLAASTLQPDPYLRLSGSALFLEDQRLSRLLDQREGRTERERSAMLDDMSPVQRWAAMSWFGALQAQQAAMEQQFDQIRRQLMRDRDYRQILAEQLEQPAPAEVVKKAPAMKWVGIGALALWPVLAVAWAFCACGGLSYALAGIRIVRRDGRPASRLQCLWRAALVWLPVGLLLSLSVYHEFAFWEQWNPVAGNETIRWLTQVSLVEWYAGIGLLLAGFIIALVYPQRALHDRLAGTYLVPR